ncbi:MAG: motility protein A [Spirochaetales bacterium]|nr:MAG: motility protein A [Spirochaetales bacterium]
MDLATIIGLLLGAGALLLGIISGGGSLGRYIDIPSVFVTIGGSIGALIVSNPLSRVLGMFKYAKHALNTPKYEEERLISTLVSFSEKARREGLLALEDDLEDVPDEFMRKGIQLVVDGTDPEIIKTVMFTELNQMNERHAIGIKLFSDWGKLAPAWGMIGTLAGLIAMLANLQDTSAIGAGMALALITSLYGAIIANLICIPFTAKLEDRDKAETLVKEIVIEGVLSIQSGDNPRILEQKLVSFLPPSRREAVLAESAKE